MNKLRAVAVFGLALIGTSPSSAQQKTIKACQDEWRANKAANQANHIIEKAYVEQCRAGVAQSAPAPLPEPAPRQAPAPAPRSSRAPAPSPTAAAPTPRPAPAPAPAPVPTPAPN
jgi:hypothetical protein